MQGEYEIAIVGPKLPSWVQGVTHIKQTSGRLKTALCMAAEAYPSGFSWWYDDCVLIKDQTIEQIKLAPAKENRKAAGTSWMGSLLKVRDRLAREGFVDRDYSTPHGPYFFDKGMIDESFLDWPGMSGKFPFETWILSKRNAPWQSSNVVAQYYGAFRAAPTNDRIFVNWCDAGMTPELISWLESQFPNPSPYEKIDNIDEIVSIAPRKAASNRVLFTCHEGCDKRVWRWCESGIKHFAQKCDADLIELPKCKDANPQWVLFDAFAASLVYEDGTEFAWVDSDLVIANNATNIFEEYPKTLHVCVNASKFSNKLKDEMNLPTNVKNVCTGVVKWKREEAQKLSLWYTQNKFRFPKSEGDQELLVVALHELGIATEWFHPQMHVAGANPPAKTAFKHKGGSSKVKWIPRFLEINRRHGLLAVSENESNTGMATYRICSPKNARPNEVAINPVMTGNKVEGTTMAHMRAMMTIIENGQYPCLVLEEDATRTSFEAIMPNAPVDWLFVGLSQYTVENKEKGILWTNPPVVCDGLIDMDGMCGTHAVIYYNKEAAIMMHECGLLALSLKIPIDVAVAKYCQSNGITRKGLAKPLYYQNGANACWTNIEL